MHVINDFIGQYRFLSNYAPSVVQDENGIPYPTVEHAFAAAKTLDLEQKVAISQKASPGAAKSTGRHVALRTDWEQVKTSVMKDLLWQKFSSTERKDLLLGTGNSLLIEGNTWHDQYWGNCVCDKHITEDGKNALGTLLMMTRLYLNIS